MGHGYILAGLATTADSEGAVDGEYYVFGFTRDFLTASLHRGVCTWRNLGNILNDSIDTLVTISHITKSCLGSGMSCDAVV
jgi:hypothetical protein